MTTTIFEQQTLTGFAYDDSYGAYALHVNPAPFELSLGETYSVYWDGEIYICESQDLSSIAEGDLALGNLSAFGGQGNNEPFIIGWSSFGVSVFAFDEKTEHEVAIYQSESGIVLKDFAGNDIEYTGVKGIAIPNADGTEQIFTPGQPQTKTIDLDFSNGDVTVEPDAEYVLTKVDIPKPTNLIPEFIKKDEIVAGIKGSYEGSGGGGEETRLHEEYWLDDICFWDYDGNLLKNISMSEIQNFSEADFPTAPTYDNLTFQCWNHSVEDIRTTKYPLDITPTYSTIDGKTHIKIKPYNTSHNNFKFNFSQTVANGVSFDFGDGSAVQTVSGTGVVSISHTYSSVQEYDLTISVSDGCVLTLGGGTSSTSFVVGASSTATYYKYAVLQARLADNVELNDYAFYYFGYINFLSLPQTLTTIPTSAFGYNNYLNCAAIPNGVETIGKSAFISFSNDSTKGFSGVVSIPQSVTAMGQYVFGDAYFTKRIAVPRLIDEIPTSAFRSMYKLKRCFLPDGVHTVGDYFLYQCRSLEKIELPKSLSSIGTYFLGSTFALDNVSIPVGVTTIGSYAFSDTGIREIFVPPSVNSIGTKFCNATYTTAPSIRKIVFEDASNLTLSDALPTTIAQIIILSATPPTSAVLNYMLPSGNYYADCIVPDEAVEDYKALLSNYKYRIKPLSEYNGTLPSF